MTAPARSGRVVVALVTVVSRPNNERIRRAGRSRARGVGRGARVGRPPRAGRVVLAAGAAGSPDGTGTRKATGACLACWARARGERVCASRASGKG